jgi:hypothetical protein
MENSTKKLSAKIAVNCNPGRPQRFLCTTTSNVTRWCWVGLWRDPQQTQLMDELTTPCSQLQQ